MSLWYFLLSMLDFKLEVRVDRCDIHSLGTVVTTAAAAHNMCILLLKDGM